LSTDDSVKDLIRAPFYRRLANFALDIKSKVRDYANQKNLAIQLRIGMNVGPIAAGVIGKTKLAYDVWGGNLCAIYRL
jgi:class 3 adenylate cyclase